MRAELRLLNALIGMTLPPSGPPGSTWPWHLHDLGFRLTSLQPEITLANGNRRATKLTPEAAFQSERLNAILLVESKSATFEDRQAQKYCAVTALDLVAHAAVRETAEVATAVVAPGYFSETAHTPRLCPEIHAFNTRTGCCLPLVDYDHHRFELQEGAFRLAALNDVFQAGVYFSDELWPTRFVPFDADSPESEAHDAVLSELSVMLLNPDVERFRVEELAGGGHPHALNAGVLPLFDRFGTGMKRRILGRIAGIVEEFRQAYLREELERPAAAKAWRKLGSPFESGRSQSSLQARISDYKRRKAEGIPLPRHRQVEALLTSEELEVDV